MKRKPLAETSHIKVVIVDVEYAVGDRRRGVNYSRTEFNDGSYTEHGLPSGMESMPSLDDLIEHAMKPATKRR